jgi:hypothetical protein
MSSAEELYRQRIEAREHYLFEAWRNAKLTIPHLVPDTDDALEASTPKRLPKANQSLGARGVNNLAAKLLLALLPSNSSFFRYVMSEEALDEAEETNTELSELESRLARRESRINTEVELQGIRTKAYQVFRHLIVTGNVVAYLQPEGGLQVIKLNAFTAKRNPDGKLLDLIYVEPMDRQALPPKLEEMLPARTPAEDANNDQSKIKGLYTRVLWDADTKKYESWQEFCGEEVPDSRETHDPETMPWLVLRYSAIDGEDYGNAFVEDYRGDLTAYDQLSRDAKFLSGNAAKVIFGIKPASVLKPRKFQEASNGAAVVMEPDDVTAVQLNKTADSQVTTLQLDRLERALSASFLLNSSFQRNAERVTAEEIRRLAEELEDTLGGVFSLFAQEFQKPLAAIVEDNLVRTQAGFNKLPEGAVRIGVVTGLAAIGRNQELENLRNFGGLVAEWSTMLPGLPQRLVEGSLIKMLATGTGVQTDGLIKTDEKYAEEQQAAQQAQSTQTMGAEAAKGLGPAVAGAAQNLDPEQLAQALTGGLPGAIN